MGWANNVIPMKVLECQMTCKDRDPGTGYVIHVPGCRLGREVEERIKNERAQDRSRNPKGS